MNEEVQQKSWFKRNWIWVISLSGCLTFIILLVLGIGSFFYGVTKVLTKSEPSEYAMEMTQSNVQIIESIGEPIEKNGMPSGNISYVNESGEADLQIPVKGPKGDAVVFVKAHKVEGEWIYEELYVLIENTQEKINLALKPNFME